MLKHLKNLSFSKMRQSLYAAKIFILCIFFIIFFVFTINAVQAFIPDIPDNLDSLSEGEVPVDFIGGGAINTKDVGTKKAVNKGFWKSAIDAYKQGELTKFFGDIWKKTGEKALGAALQNALNKIAYDTATWLGSGGKGQKPLFITEGWGEYFKNIADEAAGDFIENISLNYGFSRFNLCTPDLAVRVRIGLGLVQQYRPQALACTFSQMKKNWEQELQRGDFLSRLQDYFNPTSNELGMALLLQTGVSEQVRLTEQNKGLERIAGKGWLDVRNIAGWQESVPGFAESLYLGSQNVQYNKLGQCTSDALTCAANLFLNQLAITLFNNVMSQLGRGKGSYTSPYTGNYGGLNDYYAAPENQGLSGARERYSAMAAPKFNVRGDYNILSELAMCPDPNKAGPTNCVIEEKFRQAVENKITVGQALKQGYLNPNGVFGFNSDGLEPNYKEGYPYRSMIILRKFRILPVGWEVAAQYIKDYPQAEADGGAGGAKNIKDLIACYDPNDDYTGYGDRQGGQNSSDAQSWCRGLVDPNWVLKAPQNYCQREGPGPEIISAQVIGQGADSKLAVARNDNYCADEQSCIKENSDGSCKLYGYCVAERRQWDFNGKSCDPLYNTCQTFRAVNGQTVSYLENTLDYSTCNINNAGCKAYCADYDYAQDKFTCTDNAATNKVYFNRNVAACDQSAEGCHEFIRAKAGLGVNLLPNSSFEDSLTGSIWDGVGSQSEGGYEGKKSLQLTANLEKNIEVAPAGYSVAGEIFSFSFYSKNCGADDNFQISGQSAATPITSSSDWLKNQTTYAFSADAAGNKAGIKITSANCQIDALKLERAEKPDSAATAYSDYGANGIIYEKLLPSYLENTCYVGANDYRLKDDLTVAQSAQCDKYARKCNQSEVNCELYTSAASGLKVPAKVQADDYCPESCVGYDTYIQSATRFDTLQDKYFIPKTARICSAEAAGCDQFTNLDEVAKGGEGAEYYTSLRQCVKPSESGGTCDDFYTWEGSNESGYQLKKMQLQKDGEEPKDVGNDDRACTADIFNKPLGDPAHDSDCRQFYNRQGQISYHLYQNTVSCDDNCHPYRRTALNEISVTNCLASCNNDAKCAASCNTSDSCAGVKLSDNKNSCKMPNGKVVVCKNGGIWDNVNNACIYQAIPGQGQTCQAAQNGCREYSGNAGNNMRFIMNNDFENGTAQGWSASESNGAAIANSNEATIAGQHSLEVSGGDHAMNKTVGSAVEQGRPYVLRFIAKAVSNNTNPPPLTKFTAIKFVNGAGDTANFATTALSPDWQLYTVNLVNLDHAVSNLEKLVMTADGDFYIDNIRLTEIIDRYYLIENSWTTPAQCDQDAAGNAHELYMLGCDAYYDRDNKIHNLYRFNQLCQDSAVGCELMIDTKNSQSPLSASTAPSVGVGEGNIVSADSYTYVVYDQKKQCNQSDKGCELLGAPYQYDGRTIYNQTYLKNDPDTYNENACQASEVGCAEWTTGQGSSYFKDPGDQVCQWRQSAGVAKDSWGWLKKKIKRCDDGGGIVDGAINAAGNPLAPLENNICLSDANCKVVAGKNDVKCQKDSECGDHNKCVSGSCRYSCVLDDNDYICPTDELKTMGLGGPGNKVSQPAAEGEVNWTGICPAAQAECTEYIDPVSKFSSNIIFNADFSQNIDTTLVDSVDLADGWKDSQQTITLEPSTLYILAVDGANTATVATNNGSNDLYKLDSSNNELADPVKSLPVTANAASRASISFYTAKNISGLTLTAANAAVSNGSKVELKKVVVNYQLAAGLDKQSCNGVVDFNQGCILFNERNIIGKDGLAKLNKNADKTTDKNAPAATSADAPFNANAIIKVTPDRVCGQWLACRSYLKDETGNNVCFDIGACDKLDDNDNCSNFAVKPPTLELMPQLYSAVVDAAAISDLSGYSKVGESAVEAYYALGQMSQVGEVANLPNGGFETAGTNRYPIGWVYEDRSGTTETTAEQWDPITNKMVEVPTKTWNQNVFKVINNPIEAQNEGIGYAPEGDNFLKLGANFSATSELFEAGKGPYVVTAFINTKNLKSGQARVRVFGHSISNGNFVDMDIDNMTPNITLDPGNDWTFKLGQFDLSADIDMIKVMLDAVSTESGTAAQGNVYFDDINIRPALNSKNGTVAGTQWYTPQSCRLYPQSDALSCNYYDDSGARQNGWRGYCLEYDRKPGNPNACLLWWPVDKVKGEGVEEGAGYIGRAPLYYCANAVLQIDNQGLAPINIGGKINVTQKGPENIFWANQGDHGDLSGGFSFSYNYIKQVIPGRSYSVIDAQGRTDQGGTAPYILRNDLSLLDIRMDDGPPGDEGHYSFNLYDNDLKQIVFSWGGNVDVSLDIIFTPFVHYCNNIVRVVTPTGLNKYWSNRVYEGSDYNVPKLNYNYLTSASPFGSMVPPAPIINPYEWDSDSEKTGNQPIYAFNDQNKNVHAGSPYSSIYFNNPTNTPWLLEPPLLNTVEQATGIIRRLFAQSYGSWHWQAADPAKPYANGSYVSDGVNIWLPPEQICKNQSENDMAARSNNVGDYLNTDKDYCAISPEVRNIKVNGASGDVNIKSQFINLTFNSMIDGQQLPMVKYAVDWGDGETTVVSGVEMRDRAAGNPHSLYHLYSYWDLKAKSSKTDSGINCDNAGGYCKVKPKVQIKDNWGWCNKGAEINKCEDGQWDEFGEDTADTDDGWVIVREK